MTATPMERARSGRRQSSPKALITGAAHRIGAAIASDLAAHGFDVLIHANGSATAAEALAADIRAEGGKATALTGFDLADATHVAALIKAIDAIDAGGGEPVRLLVNNASMFAADEASSLDMAQFDAHFAVHVKAPLLLSQAMASRLPPEDHGLIVNMIDQRVWALTPRFFTYTLSKSTLWTATQTLAQALAPRIRVNAIGPGPTLANARQSAADFARQQDGLLLGHGPDLAEFGRTIRYLWDCPSITGQMIALDGGQHLAWETPDVADIAE
jgi:NAD(P)-dependent dehydrogenase (short-subunit alcohol dehydrogenase family)